MHPTVAEAFDPLLGLPSWLVRKGFGSFVTLEFGNPVLTVGDPQVWTARSEAGQPLKTMRRRASVHGTWHLWIYRCQWTLELDGTDFTSWESEDNTIEAALDVLNGQALSGVEFEHGARTRFQFDLGCVLATKPAPEGFYPHEPVDQWLLYQPDGTVLAHLEDGRFSTEPGADSPTTGSET